MGGTDPKNLTKLILNKLDKKILKIVNLKVLLGDSYLFKNELEQLISQKFYDTKIINGTKNVSELMKKI